MNNGTIIVVRFFASLREKLGHAELTLTLPVEINTVGQVRQFLIERGGVWAEALGDDRSLRMAYQQVMCEAGEPLQAEATQHEVAFFPPVTGG